MGEEKTENLEIREFHFLFEHPEVSKLLQLTPAEKNILQLVKGKQMTFKEIAQQFKVTPQQIKMLYEAAVNAKDKNVANVIERLEAFEKLSTENEKLKEENRELKQLLGPLWVKENSDMKKVPVEALHLTKRTYDTLKRLRINTLEDISRLKKSHLVKVKNFGAASLVLLEKELEKYLIKLRD